MMDEIWQGVRQEFSDLPSWMTFTQLVVRLLIAAILGGLIGFERERSGKAAGLRTHMLVCIGTASVMAIPEQAGMGLENLSRIIQGVMSGIGFIGAGAILKPDDGSKVEGITSAASVWFTAGIGVAAGLGREASATLATGMVLIVLVLIPKVKASNKKGAKD
ncbi:MAG: MgtC/SapB family protein [Proteobacteria bacterium]|nr:MAG: MgtC/SapB family protein [Pseudomonadota bacterium]